MSKYIRNLEEKMQSILQESLADDVAKLLDIEKDVAEERVQGLNFANYLELGNAVDINDAETAREILSAVAPFEEDAGGAGGAAAGGGGAGSGAGPGTGGGAGPGTGTGGGVHGGPGGAGGSAEGGTGSSQIGGGVFAVGGGYGTKKKKKKKDYGYGEGIYESQEELFPETEDMMGQQCRRCHKDTYQETGIQDDMHGVLHCPKCRHEVKRYVRPDEVKYLDSGIDENTIAQHDAWAQEDIESEARELIAATIKRVGGSSDTKKLIHKLKTGWAGWNPHVISRAVEIVKNDEYIQEAGVKQKYDTLQRFKVTFNTGQSRTVKAMSRNDAKMKAARIMKGDPLITGVRKILRLGEADMHGDDRFVDCPTCSQPGYQSGYDLYGETCFQCGGRGRLTQDGDYIDDEDLDEADNPYTPITPPSQQQPSKTIAQKNSNVSARKDVDNLQTGDDVEVIDIDGDPTPVTVKNPRGPGETVIVQTDKGEEHIVKKKAVSGTPKVDENININSLQVGKDTDGKWYVYRLPSKMKMSKGYDSKDDAVQKKYNMNKTDESQHMETLQSMYEAALLKENANRRNPTKKEKQIAQTALNGTEYKLSEITVGKKTGNIYVRDTRAADTPEFLITPAGKILSVKRNKDSKSVTFESALSEAKFDVILTDSDGEQTKVAEGVSIKGALEAAKKQLQLFHDISIQQGGNPNSIYIEKSFWRGRVNRELKKLPEWMIEDNKTGFIYYITVHPAQLDEKGKWTRIKNKSKLGDKIKRTERLEKKRRDKEVDEVYTAMNEVAPPGQEEWIKDRKPEFKKRYGDDWEQILYATAWRRANR